MAAGQNTRNANKEKDGCGRFCALLYAKVPVNGVRLIEKIEVTEKLEVRPAENGLHHPKVHMVECRFKEARFWDLANPLVELHGCVGNELTLFLHPGVSNVHILVGCTSLSIQLSFANY